MYYTVYKITNLTNGKIYIGAHRTSNLDDYYMGSGVKIKDDIRKYGKDNFKKEYMFIFENEREMYDMESILVNEDFIKNENVYNLSTGGYGWNRREPENERAMNSKAGSWKNIEKRRKICESIPMSKRKEIGKKLGDKYGGLNGLSSEEIEKRFDIIKDINLLKYGWVNKVSDKLGITHTQVKRFIEKYYKGEFYRRK
jgi:hypothetical protein